MDGRREPQGQRWRGGNGSEKPVSSYASLASGPPPSYARQGSNNSWDYDDMQRPPSPSGPPPRSKGPPFYGRGGGIGRGGRFDNGGGRGRPYRGGGRGDGRFRDHSSPDRFQGSTNNNQSGYESGEILHSDRAPPPRSSNIRHDRPSFEGGRGVGRLDGNEGRGPSRFIPRGGGRDSLGRGSRGGGRFYDSRGGRGGRADFRGRGRGGDGRDNYNAGKDWNSTGGAGGRPSSAIDLPQRYAGPDSASRSEDGPPRFYSSGTNAGNMPRKEPLYSSRGDDRGSSSSARSFVPNNQSRGRYSSLGTDVTILPNRNIESRSSDDRFPKRRREDQGFNPTEYEDKRNRSNDYVARNRPEDSRSLSAPSTSVPPNRQSNDSGTMNVDTRPPPSRQPGGDSERRGVSVNRAVTGDSQPGSDDVKGDTKQSANDEKRCSTEGAPSSDTNQAGLNKNDPRERVAKSSIDEPMELSRRPDGPAAKQNDETRNSSSLHRDDPRGSMPPSRSRIVPPQREDPRKAPPERFPDDNNSFTSSHVRNPQRHEPQKTEPTRRDPRAQADPRSRTLNDDSANRPPSRTNDSRDDPRRDSRLADDLYGDMSQVPSRQQVLPNRSTDDAPPSRMERKQEIGHGKVGDGAGRQDINRPVATAENKGGWTSQKQPNSQQSFSSMPGPPSRSGWNTAQNRSPRPSPGAPRRTVMAPGSDHSSSFQDAAPPDVTKGYPENRGPNSFPEDRGPFLGRGRGRGRGFRGRGRGMADFGGRFGGRGQNEYFRTMPASRESTESQQTQYQTSSSYRSMEDGWNRRSDEKNGQSSAAPPDRFAQSSRKTQNSSSSTPGTSTGNDITRKLPDRTGPDNSSATPGGKEKPAPKGPKPISPPVKGKPSGVLQALARLIDLEAQMEYAYAKHMLLVHRQAELQAQTGVLSDLPVGIDAFIEDLEKLSKGNN